MLNWNFSPLRKLRRTLETETNHRVKPKVKPAGSVLRSPRCPCSAGLGLRGSRGSADPPSGIRMWCECAVGFILHVNTKHAADRERKSYMLMIDVWFLKRIC